MLTDQQRPLTQPVRLQNVRRTQIKAIVRRLERLDHGGVRIDPTDAVDQQSTFRRGNAPLGKNDSLWPKQRRRTWGIRVRHFRAARYLPAGSQVVRHFNSRIVLSLPRVFDRAPQCTLDEILVNAFADQTPFD